jgi:hypothetical protein
MSGKHWALIGGCLVSIAAMGSAAHDWSEIIKPSFLFGALGVIGVQVGSLYARRPNE